MTKHQQTNERFVQGFEEILDIAKALEERIETGEIWEDLWTDIQIDSRNFNGFNFEEQVQPPQLRRLTYRGCRMSVA